MSRKKKTQRRNYGATFRARAIKLAQQSERSVSHVARELGIAEKTLLGWVRQASDRAAEARAPALETSEKEELEALRKENARLREETEVLKKAATYFANQSH